MSRRTTSQLDRVRLALPRGTTLPEGEFLRRHRALLGLLWLHVPIVLAWALSLGLAPHHVLLEGALVAAPAALATWVLKDRKAASALVAFGLISCSAVVVHLADGFIEAHFHFFVMIVALTLYEDWVPFTLAAVYVLLHHGVGGVVDAHAVYNHPDAIAHPWKWAGIHAGFVAAAGAAGVFSWRLSEDAREERETALRRAVAAEAAARRTADDLARSNRDLEQFAYIASHDLMEPLRTVSSFLKLLGRHLDDQLDPQAARYLGHATDGTQRMQQLIDDLLQYSRAGREALDAVPVDLDALTLDVLARLRQRVDASGARVEVAPLGTVLGDPGQLAQVLQNLLSNAMKFVADGPPVVHVAMEPGPQGMLCLGVRDNGIGIDPAHAEDVFKMFQRLHSRDEFDGTGLGLAIVQRIVQRHGGDIWVEPAPGGGSHFRVTLPPAPAPAPAPAPPPPAVAAAPAPAPRPSVPAAAG